MKKENFTLNMVMMKNNRVFYQGSQLVKKGSIPHYRKINDSEDKIPVPDFVTQFKAMNKYACIVLEDIENQDLLTGCKQANDVRVMLMASRDERIDVLQNRYTIECIKFTGSERDAGVVLVGKKSTVKGKIVNFTTPAINFESQLYGFEEAIFADCEEIKDLAFDYIYNDVHAEPTLGFAEESGEDNDDSHDED